jgi:hypothetical protein
MLWGGDDAGLRTEARRISVDCSLSCLLNSELCNMNDDMCCTALGLAHACSIELAM